MTTTTTWDAALHPREATGRFDTKEQSAPELSLHDADDDTDLRDFLQAPPTEAPGFAVLEPVLYQDVNGDEVHAFVVAIRDDGWLVLSHRQRGSLTDIDWESDFTDDPRYVRTDPTSPPSSSPARAPRSTRCAPTLVSSQTRQARTSPASTRTPNPSGSATRCDAPTITLDDATVAHAEALRAVVSRVISQVYGDFSDADQRFLDAMSEDDGPSKIGDIAYRRGVSNTYVQRYRGRLVDSGYVHPGGHEYIDFSLPYLGAFIRRRLEAQARDGGSDGGWHAYPAPDLPS